VDCRWNVIAGSVDDRTKEERGLEVFKLCNFAGKKKLNNIKELSFKYLFFSL
jgi:hypothetical protein